MDSEEIYEALTNEARVKVDKWSDEVKEMFMRCAFEGMSVEYWAQLHEEEKWAAVPADVYKRPAIYTESSTNNILRVLF